MFSVIDYNLDSKEIPPVFNSMIPEEIREMPEKKRVELFLKLILPHILKENEKIDEEREFVLSILSKQKNNWTQDEIDYVQFVAEKYNIITDNRKVEEFSLSALNNLKMMVKKRIQPIHPAIALGQSALESGWGTSRFALEGNNLFGHTVNFSNRNTMKPSRYRGKDRNYKRFGTIDMAIERYMLNINSNKAYSEFHDIRLRNPNNIKQMVESLHRYSRLGREYTDKLSKVISKYKLETFSEVKLGDSSRLTNLKNIKSIYVY